MRPKIATKITVDIGPSVSTMGSQEDIRADMEQLDPVQINRADIRRMKLSPRDLALVMHYRGFIASRICRRIGITYHQFEYIMRDAEEEMYREMAQHPDQIRTHLASRLLGMFDSVDSRIKEKVISSKIDAEIKDDLKSAVDLAKTLARLVGANAPTQVNVNSLQMRVNSEDTRAILMDPEARKLKMDLENRVIELEQKPE